MNFTLIFFSIGVALFAYIIQAYLKLRKYRTSLSKFPGNHGPIFLGNISWVLKLYYSKKTEHHPGVYIIDRMLGVGQIYDDIYTFFIGTTPLLSIHSPELLETVLSSNISLEKSYEYSFLHKWLGLGLLTSTGPKWRARRKILTPSFHFRVLEDFLPSFNDQSLILVKKLESLIDEEFIDISPLIINCTLDIVCETMMGFRIGAQQGENTDYVNAIHNLADFFNKRTITPWLWLDCMFDFSTVGRGFNKDLDVLHSFTKKVIKEKKKAMLSQPVVEDSGVKTDEFETKKRKSFMDLLLDLHLKGEQLTEEGIQEEVDTFMFEGHDTTAMGIIYALYCIGLYPEIQKKLDEELDTIFGENSERTVTMEDVRNMKYLECVLKESQRLFPSVPVIGRMLNEDIYYKGYKIPKGTTIHCNILALHRNPDIFPNPEVFDPDRFLPENSLKRHPYGYVPFSAGPRNCIGQKFALLEEKVVVSNILRHFKVMSLDPRDKVHMKIEFTLRPAQPMRLKLLRRTKCLK